MGDSNTPFLLTYEQSASASSRGHPVSPTAASPAASTHPAPASKSDHTFLTTRVTDDSSYIGARKRLLEERVFGTGSAHVASSFPVDASDIIKLVAASSPSAPTFGSVFHTPAGGLHVSAVPPAAQSSVAPASPASPVLEPLGSSIASGHTPILKPSLLPPSGAAMKPSISSASRVSAPTASLSAATALSHNSHSALLQSSAGNGKAAPQPAVPAAASAAAAAVSSAPSVEPEREELQLSEDESEFPATSPENSRSSLPHTTPENGSARVRKRKAEEKTPQKSPPKAARITNWFSRQNTSSSRRSSTNAELDPSVKTYDAFVQTDDDASRAVIAAYKKAADDAEAARRVAEEAGARQLQELGNQERSRREALEASHEAQLSRYRSELQDRIRRECALQREAARDGLHADLVTVGRPVMQRSSGSFVEVWEEGSAFRELQRRLDQLQVTRDDLEKSKRERSAAAKKRGKVSSEDADGQAGVLAAQMPPPMEVVGLEQDEIWKLQAQAIKREETAIAEEKEKLESRRASVIREFKRIRDEDRSRFNRFPTMAGRYVLMNLLGKGGFSEVYKAYDLIELRTVALKIHELNSQWSEEKKANYMRHATRESSIQKTLDHCRVFCEGSDLDLVLKMNKFLPEREGRSIIVQVVSALRYLNMQKNRIIHYDLKPANVLIHRGEVKITDFGLSKVMSEEEHEVGGMELTSQGAGTYWYLPPECFEGGRGRDAPKISSKVDVWSVGIMFYQMLFGMKPFGDGMSQEKMLQVAALITLQLIAMADCAALQEGTMLRASSGGLTFPPNPKVSQEAKDFIKRCLARVDQRPDVLTLYSDPYVRNKTRETVIASDGK